MSSQTDALLSRASNEIKGLRSQNTIMQAKLDMFDKCYAMFSTRPPERGMMHTPDVCEDISKHLEESKESGKKK